MIKFNLNDYVKMLTRNDIGIFKIKNFLPYKKFMIEYVMYKQKWDGALDMERNDPTNFSLICRKLSR